ncbi:MAG TPA: TonB-dependent receptor [Rhizomicrobium sp.]|jgi:vitamin B12 transporter|nr:TonB-dependent receptor [Rhizomicrobium sp.]
MRRLLIASISLIAVAATAGASAAQTGQTPETVVVTATRVPTPRAEVASSITVITAKEIAARQQQSLPDVLADAPGLNVVQSGGPGGETSVFMRGTDSNHVKVLVDGIDMSDPSSPTGTYDFGQFLTQDIARIEILRGPQSGLYGSDAIGGVINIITKSGSGPAQFTGDIEGGSFDTFNQAGTASGSEGPFHYAGTIEHFWSGATPVTPLDLLAPGERRIDDTYDNVTASTKLGYDVTNDFDLGFVGRYTNSQLDSTGENYFTDYPDATQSQSETLQYYTRGTAHLVLAGGFFEQTLGLAYGSIESTEPTPDNPTAYYFGDRVKLDWQGDLRFSDDEILVLGAEHEHDGITQPVSAGIDIDSGYAELQSTLAENLFSTEAVRFDDNAQFGGEATWRIAPAYLVAATGTKIEASVGTGFKAPTLSEMFENYPAYDFYGNPGLRPESSLGYDMGFEQPLFEDAVRFGGTYYRNDIKNLINDNATYTSYANVGKAETDGVEAFAEWQVLPTLNLRADYTFTEANDEILHQELLRRPKHKGTLNAQWQATDRLSLDADLLAVSSWIDGNRAFTIPRLIAPGYTTADIAASYAINDTFTLYGRITNLFDANYQDPVGFLRPGRGFFAGIKART